MKLLKVVILSFLFFMVVFPPAFMRDMWEPDEPRFALVASEMISTGDFIMPHRNARPYPDKPPLFFWTIALSSLVTGGVNSAAAILPSAMSGALLIILVFFLAKELSENDKTAFFAALILATTTKVFWQASHAQIDMLLALLTTLAMYGFIRHEKRRERRGILIAWIAMAFATLAKGPVGFIIPIGSMLVYLKWKGKGRYRSLFSGSGVIIFLLIVGTWLTLLITQGIASGETAYLENILFKQTVVRFAQSWHHHQPVYYFFKVILYDFFPWSPLLVSLAIFKLKSREFTDSEKLLFSWVLFVLVFFSIPMGKRGLYILPLYPATAILVARFLNRENLSKYFSVPVSFIAAVYALAGVGLLVKRHVNLSDGDSINLILPGCLFLGVSLLVLIFRDRPILPLVVLQLFLFSFVGYWVFPKLNNNNSARSFVQKNETFLDKKSSVAIAQFRSAHVLYGDRNLVEFPGISEEDNIGPFVAYLRNTPDSFGILSQAWTDQLLEMGVPVHILNRSRVGHKRLCFITIGDTGSE